MIKKYFICILGVLLSMEGFSQLAGQKSFEFLNIPAHSRLAAMGGVNVSLSNRDINFLFSNPALVSDSLAGMASVGYTFYVADIGQTSFAYAHRFKKVGTLSFGVQQINYGEIVGYDVTGAALGSFKSGETALVISKSHQVSNFRIGANIKTVFSNIGGYRASALMLDMGGTFVHPTKKLTIGLVLKNFGFLLSEYSTTSSTQVPFDVQAGMTFKPEHMPVRLSLTAYNLVNLKAYDNPSDPEDNVGSIEKIFQHVNIGAEFLIHRNVNILVGYNALRQHELKTLNTGGNGFTMGAALRIKAFELVMSRSSYSIGNAANAFTVITNIENMILKKRAL